MGVTDRRGGTYDQRGTAQPGRKNNGMSSIQGFPAICTDVDLCPDHAWGAR